MRKNSLPSRTDTLIPFAGRVWRAGFLSQADKILGAARAPQGRGHHSGQSALYLSGTPEGCRVALKAYQNPNDPARGIFPFAVSDARIVDLRLARTRAAFDASLDDIHTFWAKIQAAGMPPPTWALADAIRATGACGLLTPSRSRPDLTHLTLFRWNAAKGAQIRQDGDPIPFDSTPIEPIAQGPQS